MYISITFAAYEIVERDNRGSSNHHNLWFDHLKKQLIVLSGQINTQHRQISNLEILIPAPLKKQNNIGEYGVPSISIVSRGYKKRSFQTDLLQR